MGIQLQFPKNLDRYVEMGQEALNSGKCEEAVFYFEKAYTIDRSFSINLLIVTSLMAMGRHSESKEYAEDFVAEYLAHPDFFTVYVDILIQTKKFVKASKLVNSRMVNENKEDTKRWIALKSQLKQAEREHRHYESENIRKIKEKLKDLGNLSFSEQIVRLREANKLPEKDFLIVSKELLVHPHVHGLVKSSILEELVQLKLDETIDYLGFDDKRRKINLRDIGEITDCGSYQRLIMLLEKEILHSDPVLYHSLKEEIRLHFALLYPIADEVVTDPKLWAMGYLKRYSQTYTSFNKEESSALKLDSIQEIQEKIREMLDCLSM